jgi:hypothetical protein
MAAKEAASPDPAPGAGWETSAPTTMVGTVNSQWVFHIQCVEELTGGGLRSALGNDDRLGNARAATKFCVDLHADVGDVLR